MRKFAVLLLSLSFAAFAQDAAQKSTGKGSAAKSSHAAGAGPMSDEQFVTKAGQANMAEVELGKMAAEKGQSDDVKQFGQHMVDDHTKAGEELKGIASKNNWSMPGGVTPEQQATAQRLEKLSGHAFDRAFMQTMVKDHLQAVNLFRREANSTAANSDLRDFANRTYPTLDEHLTRAKAVNGALPKSGVKSGKSASKSTKKDTSLRVETDPRAKVI